MSNMRRRKTYSHLFIKLIFRIFSELFVEGLSFCCPGFNGFNSHNHILVVFLAIILILSIDVFHAPKGHYT